MGFLSGLFGGGSKINTGYSQELMEKALRLNERIYNEDVERMQPFYDTGVGANNLLADYLGITGGSNKSRDQIYNELMPQYTRTETYGDNAETFMSPDGRVFTRDNYGDIFQGNERDSAQVYLNALDANNQDLSVYKDMGYDRLSLGPQTRDITDYNALNAAVDDRFAAQGTPDNYGSLLDPFTANDFEYSPAYNFNLEQGEKALARAQAARGNFNSPSAFQELLDYSQGLASNEYNNAYNMDAADKDRIYNMLMGTTGTGMGAANSQAASGQNYANSATQLYGQQSQLDLSRQSANNQRRQSAFGNLFGLGTSLIGLI